jgi:hypothetical protein
MTEDQLSFLHKIMYDYVSLFWPAYTISSILTLLSIDYFIPMSSLENVITVCLIFLDKLMDKPTYNMPLNLPYVVSTSALLYFPCLLFMFTLFAMPFIYVYYCKFYQVFPFIYVLEGKSNF